MAENAKRFFFGRDNSSHWYLVPAEHKAEWEAWTGIDEDDERAWDAPEYAQLIDSPYGYTFEEPEAFP